MIFSICSDRSHRSAQIEQLDSAILSSSSTENTTSTTSRTTSPYSQQREAEKQTDKTVIASSCTSPVAENELANKEPIDSNLDLCSAPGDRIQNDYDGLSCSNTLALRADSSASTQQADYSPQPTSASQPSEPNSDCIDKAAMREPALESPARTQLLTRLSALTNEGVDSLRLNTKLASALDRYLEWVGDALEYFPPRDRYARKINQVWACLFTPLSLVKNRH